MWFFYIFERFSIEINALYFYKTGYENSIQKADSWGIIYE
jgi:hypothetical protein